MSENGNNHQANDPMSSNQHDHPDNVQPHHENEHQDPPPSHESVVQHDSEQVTMSSSPSNQHKNDIDKSSSSSSTEAEAHHPAATKDSVENENAGPSTSSSPTAHSTDESTSEGDAKNNNNKDENNNNTSENPMDNSESGSQEGVNAKASVEEVAEHSDNDSAIKAAEVADDGENAPHGNAVDDANSSLQVDTNSEPRNESSETTKSNPGESATSNNINESEQSKTIQEEQIKDSMKNKDHSNANARSEDSNLSDKTSSINNDDSQSSDSSNTQTTKSSSNPSYKKSAPSDDDAASSSEDVSNQSETDSSTQSKNDNISNETTTSTTTSTTQTTTAADTTTNNNNNNNEEDEEDGPREKVLVDYASKLAGAQILEKSPSLKGTSNLLTGDIDRYAIAPCEDKKYVVIGLSEDILVKQIKLSNYERYSSHVKEFQLLASQEYPAPPTSDYWSDLGVYTAKSKSGEQAFELKEPAWARYLKVRFLSHYGKEHYCTVSQIKVHGSTMLQGFHEQWIESEKKDRELAGEEEEEEEIEEEGEEDEDVEEENEGEEVIGNEEEGGSKEGRVEEMETTRAMEGEGGAEDDVARAENAEFVGEIEEQKSQEGASASSKQGVGGQPQKDAGEGVVDNTKDVKDSVHEGAPSEDGSGGDATDDSAASESKDASTNVTDDAKAQAIDNTARKDEGGASKDTSSADLSAATKAESEEKTVDFETDAYPPEEADKLADDEVNIEPYQATNEKSKEPEEQDAVRFNEVGNSETAPKLDGTKVEEKAADNKTESLPDKSANADVQKEPAATKEAVAPIRNDSSIAAVKEVVKAAVADATDALKEEVNVAVNEIKKMVRTKIGGMDIESEVATVTLNSTLPETRNDNVSITEAAGDISKSKPEEVASTKENQSSTENKPQQSAENAASGNSAKGAEKPKSQEQPKKVTTANTDNLPTKVSILRDEPKTALPTKKDMKNAAISTGEIITKLSQRFPSASCIKDLDFKSFKTRTLIPNAGPGAQVGGGAKMEPIFAKITNEIKSVQTSQQQYEQYISAVKACYEKVFVDMANELDSAQSNFDFRLSSLERRLSEFSSGGQNAAVNDPGTILPSFLPMPTIASVMPFEKLHESSEVMYMFAGIFAVVLLMCVRRRKRSRREHRPLHQLDENDRDVPRAENINSPSQIISPSASRDDEFDELRYDRPPFSINAPMNSATKSPTSQNGGSQSSNDENNSASLGDSVRSLPSTTWSEPITPSRGISPGIGGRNGNASRNKVLDSPRGFFKKRRPNKTGKR